MPQSPTRKPTGSGTVKTPSALIRAHTASGSGTGTHTKNPPVQWRAPRPAPTRASSSAAARAASTADQWRCSAARRSWAWASLASLSSRACGALAQLDQVPRQDWVSAAWRAGLADQGKTSAPQRPP